MNRIPGEVESIGALIRQAAQDFGERVAVDWFESGASLSFTDLDQWSNRVAAGLQEKGYRKGAHIAVMLPDSPAFLLVWFAIAKIGGVMVPVDINTSSKVLDHLLSHSDAQALVIDENFLPKFNSMANRPALLSDKNIFIASEEGGLGELDVTTPLARFHPGYGIFRSDLASLQYIPSITGPLRGCMLAQDYWMLEAQILGGVFDYHDISRVLAGSPLLGADGQRLLLASLTTGCTVFMPDEMRLSRVLDRAHNTGAEYCVLPESILDSHPPETNDKSIPLKYVHTPGWSPEKRAVAEARFNLVARDSFWMTEVGTAMVCPDTTGENTCGVAAPGHEIRLAGENSELQVRGRAIMAGYYKHPEANAKAFDGDWFCTGEPAVKDDDGYHRMVAQKTKIIRRDGVDIQSSEVETAICAAPEIAKAVAVAVSDDQFDHEILVLVQLAEEAIFPAEAVKAHAADCLARSRQPRYLAYVADFPRSPNMATLEVVFDLHEGTVLSKTEMEQILQ